MQHEKSITGAELALLAGTRVAMGVGLGLLLAGRMNRDQRRAAGWTLLTLAGLTTIPLAKEIWHKSYPESRISSVA